MLSKSTEIFAKSIRLKLTENSAFGIYGEYFIAIYEAKTKKILKISCYIGNSDEYAEDYLNLNDGIRAVIGKYSVSDYSVSENGIRIFTSAPIASLRELTDYVIGLLDENGIPNSHYCSDCGTEFKVTEKRRVVTVAMGNKEEKRLLCEKCALTAAEEAEEGSEIEKTENDGEKLSYKKGILLSIFAGLAGTLIYVFLFFLLGVSGRAEIVKYLTCLVGFIIGGAVFLIFKSVTGRVDSKGMLAICCISTALMMVSHFFGCIFGLAKYLNRTFSIGYSTFAEKFTNYINMQFTDSLNLRFLIIGLIISLCAAFIAIIILYSMDFKKADIQRRVKVTIQTVK